MTSDFPMRFMQPLQCIPFRDPPNEVDDPFGDRINGEVAAMNREFIEDEKLRTAGHND